MKRHVLRAVAACLALGMGAAACSSAARPAPAPSPGQAQGPAAPAHWVPFRHVPGVFDLAGPRGDGSFTVAAAPHLLTLSRPGTLTPFATGAGGYSTGNGIESYITLPGNVSVAGAGCAFRSDTVYALAPGTHPGLIEVSPNGQARRFANLPAGLPDGIAFDSTGHFGHKLLVADKSHGATTVLAVDCAGRVATITTHAPVLEGGIAVAPASFGAYGGDLIGPNELTGLIYAIAPDGTAATLAVSGLPHGPDTGVESEGFVPPGFSAADSAYLADRLTRHNKHPGTDNILRLAGAELIKEGARAGDLVVATEASARTILVRCAGSCTVKYIAAGPAVTHAEGHIVFTRTR